MINQNPMHRKAETSFITGLLSLVLCIAMLVGTTLAWFTDTASSGNNIIKAGNLDMEVYHVNASVNTAESIADAVSLWNKDVSGNDILWEPGVVSYETFTVKNVGNLALTYKLLLNKLADSQYNTVVSTDESNGKSLRDVLYVHTVTGAAASSRPATKMDAGDKTIAQLLAADAEILSGSLEPGASSDALTVYIYWPTDSGNECNLQNGKYASDATAETVGNLWIDLSVTAEATQYTSESDSFDNQYDAEAEGEDSSGDDDNSSLTVSSDAAFTLGTSMVGWTNTETAYLESSTDGETWAKWDGSSLDSGADNKIYLRGKGLTTLASNPNDNVFTNFTFAAEEGHMIDCSGNIMTLLDYENPDEVTMGGYAFAALFANFAYEENNTPSPLRTAPSLPAKTLSVYCYYGMFSDCTSLEAAPELPATELAAGCYGSMLSGCIALTTAPKLQATTLVDECYYCMFAGCENLNITECDSDDPDKFVTIPSTDNLDDPVLEMFINTAQNHVGTLGSNPDAGKSYKVGTPLLTFTANTAGSTVTPNFVSGSYQYSTDNGTTWTDGTNDGTTTITLTNADDKVLLKGTNCVTSGSAHFEMTGSIAAGGNVTSLTNGAGGDAVLTEACYSKRTQAGNYP